MPADPERVPVTDAHFHGVSDPMTGSLLRVPGTGNPLVPQACQRTTPIFDGRMRYNLQFAYKRMEQVKTDKGYEGPVVVCAVYFVPVAGYIPHRSTIKYLASQRDMEVWLAPVGSTRVLVPYRISIPTPIGMGVMQATQFVSVALPRAAAVGHQDAVRAQRSLAAGPPASQLSTAYPQNRESRQVDSPAGGAPSDR